MVAYPGHVWLLRGGRVGTRAVRGFLQLLDLCVRTVGAILADQQLEGNIYQAHAACMRLLTGQPLERTHARHAQRARPQRQHATAP